MNATGGEGRVTDSETKPRPETHDDPTAGTDPVDSTNLDPDRKFAVATDQQTLGDAGDGRGNGVRFVATDSRARTAEDVRRL